MHRHIVWLVVSIILASAVSSVASTYTRRAFLERMETVSSDSLKAVICHDFAEQITDTEFLLAIIDHWRSASPEAARTYIDQRFGDDPRSLQALVLRAASAPPEEWLSLAREAARLYPGEPMAHRIVVSGYVEHLLDPYRSKKYPREAGEYYAGQLERDSHHFQDYQILSFNSPRSENYLNLLKSYQWETQGLKESVRGRLFDFLSGRSNLIMQAVIVLLILLVFALLYLSNKKRLHYPTTTSILDALWFSLLLLFVFELSWYIIGGATTWGINLEWLGRTGGEGGLDVPVWLAFTFGFRNIVPFFEHDPSRAMIIMHVVFLLGIFIVAFLRSYRKVVLSSILIAVIILLEGIYSQVFYLREVNVELLGKMLSDTFVNVGGEEFMMLASNQFILVHSFILTLLFILLAGLRIFVKHRLVLKQTREEEAEHVTEKLKQEQYEEEMKRARELQAGLLPKAFFDTEKYKLYGASHPAEEVGGDYFDFFKLDNGQVVCVIGDVSGRGLEAGVVMAMVKASLHSVTMADTDTELVLHALNRTVRMAGKQNKLFMSFCYAMLDPEEGLLSCSINGHPFPLIRKEDGTIQAIKAETSPLGVQDTIDVHVRQTRLDPGDRILFYTDGLTEITNNADEPWGYDALQEAFADVSHLTLEKIVEKLIAQAMDHAAGRKADDDLTLVCVEVH